MVKELSVSLRGFGGKELIGDSFFEAVGKAALQGVNCRPGKLAYQAASINLFAVDIDELQEAEEPTEEFAMRVREGFARAAEVLVNCSAEGLKQWRAVGKKADIFIGGWMESDQFDLELPAEFLAACGRLELSVSICTND